MKLIPIESSMLNKAGYDEKTRELGVVFNTGDMYIYENVPPSKYAGLLEAESVGAYMHKFIINIHPYRRMNRAGDHNTALKTARKGRVIPFRKKRDVSPQ